MNKLKPFQQATVDVVLQAFKQKERIRGFLVADEVGLGKTLVAQEVIRLSFKRRKPLVVFYVCSNLSIASQNRRRLLEILPEEKRAQAQCPVDRLTLMPAEARPSHPQLHLYTLTPETSIPVRTGRRRDGRLEERALIHALIEELWPRFLQERGEHFFRRQAHSSWDWALQRQRQKVKGNQALINAFQDSVRTEFGVPPRHRVVTYLRQKHDALELIAHFRNALAASAIEDIKPDIVIFDEFQRFRDLIAEEIQGPSARVIHRLRGERSEKQRPSLLLLSATPYRLYARRWEDETGTLHHAEFFQLVEFLYGNDTYAAQQRQSCETAFRRLADELRTGQPHSDVAHQARAEVEEILRPIIARTERASHAAGWIEQKTITLDAPLQTYDLEVFRHLSDSLQQQHRATAVHFWTSIPLPMQTMDSHYTSWKAADSIHPNGAPQLTPAKRNQFTRLRVWPHPRLRALIKQLPPEQLALPWSRPSLPWWPLDGKWANDHASAADGIDGKLLIFSRFRAVPQAVASLLSYEMEAEQLRKDSDKLPYAKVSSRKRLQPGPTRQALLALFHPSPWLGTVADPLAAETGGLEAVRVKVRQQLHKSLNGMGIQVRQKPGVRPIWQLLARIERLHGSWPQTIAAWRKLHNEIRSGDDLQAGLGKLLSDWEQEAAEPLNHVTVDELNELVEYAISAPGIILGRALRRHWSDALTEQGFQATLSAAWSGLRTYFDQPWFAKLFAQEQEKENYPLALRQAMLDGNFEALLDEHLWIIQQIHGVSDADLAHQLRNVLQLRPSDIYFHRLGDKKASKFSLRCHTALPFIQSQQVTLLSDDDETKSSLRTDELRRAFNSPFWPHVLATTSVGQEGLDFHVWCNNILHWDLSRNPVDMEQREGRLMRFGGLSVRRALAKEIGPQALKKARSGKSPWTILANLADKDKDVTDRSGLEPWWIFKEAGLNRYVFDVPLSEQKYRLSWLREQRLLYRLVLGLPHQEEFVEILGEKMNLEPDDLREAVLQLSPWFYLNCNRTD